MKPGLRILFAVLWAALPIVPPTPAAEMAGEAPPGRIIIANDTWNGRADN